MNHEPLKQFIPFGRLAELRSREDASLIAFCPGVKWDADYRVKRYTSRLALETFLKTPGKWHALVKNKVHPNMLVNRAFEVEQ